MKAIAILALAAFDLAAADSKPSTMTVRVVPEVVVSVQGMQSVGLKIRLSEMAKAQDRLTAAVPLLVPRVADSVRCTNSDCYSM